MDHPKKDSPIDRKPRILGVVLAGGRSRRFGRDKALEPVPGGDPRGLAHHALDLLAPVVDGRVLVRTQGGVEVPGDVEVVEDLWPGQGPLQALVAAFRACPADAWLVAPCDVPGLTADLYRRLLEGPTEGPGAYYVTRRGPEPLVSVFRRRGLAVLETALAADASIALKRVLESEGFRPVRARAQEELCFRNINTPADWQALAAGRNESPTSCVRTQGEVPS